MSELPRPSRARGFAVNFVFHNVALVITLLYGIILVPLYLKHIPIDLYGAWLATGNVLAWVEIVDPGLSGILQQRTAFIAGTGDRRRLAEVICTGAALSAGLSFLPLIAWPLSSFLGGWVGLDGAAAEVLARSFQYGLVGMVVALLGYTFNSVNLGLQMAMTQGLVYTASSLAGLVATIYLLVAGYGLPALPLGQMVRSGGLFLGNAVPLVAWYARHLKGMGRVSRDEARGIAGLMGFSFVSRLGSIFGDRMDAFLTAALISPSAAAMLSLTGRAYDPVKLFTTRVATSLLPGLAHLAGEGDLERAGVITLRVSRVVGAVAAIAVAGVVALDQPFVSLWVGPHLFAGEHLAMLMGLATFSFVMTNTLSQLVFAVGGIRPASLTNLAEAVVKVGAQVALLSLLGIVGVPLAALAASLATGVWFLPRAFSRLTHAPIATQARAWLGNTALLAALAGGAVLYWRGVAMDIVWTWWRFVLHAGLVGSLGLAAALLSNTALRAEIGSILARFRARPRA